MSDTSISPRPEFMERWRADLRGEPYRPAKRKKVAPAPPPDPEEARNLFTICTGNRWMELGERQPEAKMLFGEFWYEHEICLLFANTNTGKSVLAVQIADAIARGRKTGPFVCQLKQAKVIYADFELSALQFHRRYTFPDRDYNFPEHFYRAEFNTNMDVPDDSGECRNLPDDEWLIAGLEYRINQLKATVLIIDNLTCLSSCTGNASGALHIMKRLQQLRNEYKLSILVLAHTPKRRNPAHPISADDVNGSKLLVNFADSAFTIGVSNNDSAQRYLKQIKQRNTSQVYGGDNVCLCRIQKPLNFLQFVFEGQSAEQRLLLSRAQARHEMLTTQVKALSDSGIAQHQIHKELNISIGLVNKLLK